MKDAVCPKCREEDETPDHTYSVQVSDDKKGEGRGRETQEKVGDGGGDEIVLYCIVFSARTEP